MGKIIPWNGVTRLDSDPDRLLEECSGSLEQVIVIGFDKGGDEFFKSSIADGGTVLWLMERTKMKLLAMPEEM